MNNKLSLKNLISIGFMIFATFLGAGNIIFPVFSGYMAGENICWAIMGFLTTGVGLPLLGIIVIARLKGDFNELCADLPKHISLFIGILAFSIVGPFFAIPRTAILSYEASIIPFFSNPGPESRLIFSSVFFILCGAICLKRDNLAESIGTILTPILIGLLIILGVSTLFNPTTELTSPKGEYTTIPFLAGFFQGYLTMDLLGALMFSLVIIINLKSHGVTDNKAIINYTVKAGLIASIGLVAVYISFFYLGASSHSLLADPPSNGRIILSTYTDYTFGKYGSLLLGGIILLACLTTAIGLMSSAAEYFEKTVKIISYQKGIGVIAIISSLFSLMELDTIIELFFPVLQVLYPIFILLIFLSFIRSYIPNPAITYRTTLAITFIFSALSVINNKLTLPIINKGLHYLPGSENGLTWIVPCIVTFILSLLIKKQRTHQNRRFS